MRNTSEVQLEVWSSVMLLKSTNASVPCSLRASPASVLKTSNATCKPDKQRDISDVPHNLFKVSCTVTLLSLWNHKAFCLFVFNFWWIMVLYGNYGIIAKTLYIEGFVVVVLFCFVFWEPVCCFCLFVCVFSLGSMYVFLCVCVCVLFTHWLRMLTSCIVLENKLPMEILHAIMPLVYTIYAMLILYANYTISFTLWLS